MEKSDLYREAFDFLEKAAEHIGPWENYCPPDEYDREAEELRDRIKAFVGKMKSSSISTGESEQRKALASMLKPLSLEMPSKLAFELVEGINRATHHWRFYYLPTGDGIKIMDKNELV